MDSTTITRDSFGTFDGQDVDLWTVTRDTVLGPVTLDMTNVGAAIQWLILPDADGEPSDIAHG